MFKRMAMVLSCCMLLSCSALAQEITGRVHPSLPEMTFCAEDAGESAENLLRPNLMRITARTQDGSFTQEIMYESAESAGHDGAAPLIRLIDVNTDGYQDMLLLAAQGVRNMFYAVSLWDVEAEQFQPVLRGSAWDTERKVFAGESVQLELCNFELDEEKRQVLSSVQDGYRFRTEIVYEWEGRYSLAPKAVLDVYDAGEGQIGERLELHATWITRCWDAQYPEDWYAAMQIHTPSAGIARVR